MEGSSKEISELVWTFSFVLELLTLGPRSVFEL